MQPIAPSAFTPVLLMAGIGWIYYRRIHRQFGRQQWRPGAGRWVRLILLAVLLVSVLLAAINIQDALLPVAAGIAIGALLGWLALRHTHIETVDGAHWYTPNPWIGGALSLLLVGRLAWRWSHGAFMSGDGASAMQQASPLTLAFVSTLLAYYLVQGLGLAWRMQQLTTRALA
jgi:hypothetical protein